MSEFRLADTAAGAVVGIVGIALAHNVSAQIQLPGVAVTTCNVSLSLGALKTWEAWPVFEDAARTLRAIAAAGKCGTGSGSS